MDLEPGRCRRTDGKKWRCRLAVLPDQKYCERHVHRGCLRSRKPVEVDKTFSTSNSTITSSISSVKASPNRQSNMKSNARNNNIDCIKNKSFKIKKRTRENAREPIEFSFFPKSVLQHGNVTESERCRRTDGKKWRCSKDTLPEQKYCAQHIHRGVKKVENRQILSNGLSFSVGASYQKTGDDGNGSDVSSSSGKDDGSDPNGPTNSSSSEATTISM